MLIMEVISANARNTVNSVLHPMHRTIHTISAKLTIIIEHLSTTLFRGLFLYCKPIC